MSVKSKLKTVGKVALKVAPYAAMAIPGVGIPLSMAIQGGLAAANAKASGGSWKQAALAGGIGAGTGALTGGLGPSSKVASEGAKKVAGEAAKRTAGSVLKGVAKQTAKGVISDVARGAGSSILQGAAQNRESGPTDGVRYGSSPSGATAVSRSSAGVMPRGGYSWDENPMNQVDQRNPNLAQSIFQGRQEAIKSQPFRRGYDVTTNIGEPDENGIFQNQRVTRMPKIYSTGGRGR